MIAVTEQELLQIFQTHPSVCTDSRKPVKGSIFFALSGPSFNGNEFASDALEKGCIYAVVNDAQICTDSRFLFVNDVLLSLQALARNYRRTLKATFIGITGSNGKTTSKELIRDVLQRKFKTYATLGNLNNHIGVPLTLLSIPKDTEMVVVEMGANKQGDIRELAEIAEPTFGLITNIGKAHLEGMGGLEGVLKTKTELFKCIKEMNGWVFLNTNHADLVKSAATMNTINYGNTLDASFQGTLITEHPFVALAWTDSISKAKGTIHSHLPGYYNFENLLAAACIGNYFGVSPVDIDRALSSYEPSNHRSQIIYAGTNKLFMDGYNANPTSMDVSLRSFAKEVAPNKLVILGKMMELGEFSAFEHEVIGKLAISFPHNKVVLIGKEYPNLSGVFKHFQSTDEAIDYFHANPVNDRTILIKGSRANALERLLEVFDQS